MPAKKKAAKKVAKKKKKGTKKATVVKKAAKKAPSITTQVASTKKLVKVILAQGPPKSVQSIYIVCKGDAAVENGTWNPAWIDEFLEGTRYETFKQAKANMYDPGDYIVKMAFDKVMDFDPPYPEDSESDEDDVVFGSVTFY